MADRPAYHPLLEVVREAMKPRLIREIPPGEVNAGAQEWEQPGVEEIADAVEQWAMNQRHGCRWHGGNPSPMGGPWGLHHNASPSHGEGAWCNDCYLFAPLAEFDGGYIDPYLRDSGERKGPTDAE